MKALQYLLSKKFEFWEGPSYCEIFTEGFFFLFNVPSAFQSLKVLISEPVIHLCTYEVVY